MRTHIKGLRQKLKKAGLSGVITTVYGLGYRLQPVPLPAPVATGDPNAGASLETSSGIDPENQLNLASLWQSVRASYLQRVAAAADSLRSLQPGQVDQAIRERLLFEAHALSGSLGSFGFKTAAVQWREIEDILRTHDQLSTDLLSRMERSTILIDRSLVPGNAPSATVLPVPIADAPQLCRRLCRRYRQISYFNCCS